MLKIVAIGQELEGAFGCTRSACPGRLSTTRTDARSRARPASVRDRLTVVVTCITFES